MNRPSIRAVLLLGVLVCVGAIASPVGLAAGQTATTVDSCTTIDAPGEYVLTTDVASDDARCIEITASDVTFSGGGHTVSGNGSGYGVVADGSSGLLSNVTVERLAAAGWSRGVFYLGVENGTIADTITRDSTEGVGIRESRRITIRNATAYDNALGIAVGGDSTNNTVRDAIAVENKWGIHFELDSGDNTVVDSVARRNTRWGYYAFRNERSNVIENLSLDTARISFVGTNIAARADATPAALPDDRRGIGSYAQVVSAGGRSSSSLSSFTMQYADGMGVDESALELWISSLDDRVWTAVDGSAVNTSANRVSATGIETFGTFGLLAPGEDGGEATATTARPITVRETMTRSAPPTRTPFSTTATATTTTRRSTTTAPTLIEATAITTEASSTTRRTDPESSTTVTTTQTATSATDSTTSLAPRSEQPTTDDTNAASTGTDAATTSGNGPGFGPVVALLALLAAVVLAVRHDRRR